MPFHIYSNLRIKLEVFILVVDKNAILLQASRTLYPFYGNARHLKLFSFLHDSNDSDKANEC